MTGAEGEQLKQIAEDVSLIKKILMGNGHPQDGVVMQVDRLKENEKRRDKWMMLYAGGCISGIITVLVEIFKH